MCGNGQLSQKTLVDMWKHRQCWKLHEMWTHFKLNISIYEHEMWKQTVILLLTFLVLFKPVVAYIRFL